MSAFKEAGELLDKIVQVLPVLVRATPDVPQLEHVRTMQSLIANAQENHLSRLRAELDYKRLAIRREREQITRLDVKERPEPAKLMEAFLTDLDTISERVEAINRDAGATDANQHISNQH